MNSTGTLVAVAAWVATVASGLAPSPAAGARSVSDPSTPTQIVRSGSRVVALLSGCRIVVIDATSGAVIAERSLGDSAVWKSGTSLGRNGARDRVFATLTHRTSHVTAIVRFDLADLTVHLVATIPDSIVYPRLVVGPRTGRLFIAADSGFRIAMLDPANTANISRYSSGRNPAIYRVVPWFTVSPDESRLFVSYHGDASGVDWIDIRGSRFVACTESITRPVRAGCGSAHGRVEPYRDGFVAATGGGLVVADSSGTETASFGTGLSSRNHFMEFALDTAGGRAYIIGPCVMDGGVSRVGLSAPGPIRVLSTACGERVVMSNDRRLLAISSGTTVSILDADTGTLVRKTAVPAPVLDIAFVDG